jgi:replicative DNA helicase
VAQVAQLPDPAPVPPQNLEAEESVLGAMMLSPNAIDTVTDVVDPSDFYRESHAKIFRAARDLYTRGEPVDAITLVDELEERGELEGVGGRVRINELAALVPATANVGHYARIVREMATLRGLVRAGTEIARLGWERPGPAPDLVDRAEQVVFDLAQQRVASEFDHIETLLKESFERITQLYEAGEDVTGTPTGFRDLDRLTSGFQRGNLVIAAARPSMGKSALAICIAANLAVRMNVPVAVFTLEMSKAEVTQRLMCSEAKVESQRLRTGKLAPDDWPRLTAACDKLMKAPIYVDDTSSVTMMEIRSKSRRLKSREPTLGLVIVDYLQLMTSGASVENRVQEVSQISRSLKLLARDLDVPVLALSQLSRAVEQRHDKRPILSDLRESGCLAGESLVYLPDEGVHRPIRELVGGAGFNVLAMDTDSWQLVPRRVLRALATGRKPVYRLTTRLGRTIRATGNHKFLAFDGWRRLDDTFPGIRIAVPRSLPGPDVMTLTHSELALLGRLVAAGARISGRTIHYPAKTAVLARSVEALAADVFGEGVELRTSPRPLGGYRVEIAAHDEAALAQRQRWDLRPDDADNRIPGAVFAQSEASIALFLRHLWADGGSMLPSGRTRGPAVRYECRGEALARDVASLLLRLRVVAAVRRIDPFGGGEGRYRVEIVGRRTAERFLQTVGNGIWVREVEPAPDGRARLFPFPLWPQAQRATSPSATGRARVAAVADIVESAELRRLAASDVCWDEVVSIEPDGEQDVYDLTVDDLHNFVADGVVAHNSLEQDADLVLFIYRDEHYNPEESADKGLAEIILSKHRNGPTGVEKLSFLSRYAKFADLAQH